VDNIGGLILIGLIWLVGMFFDRARKAQAKSRTRVYRPPTPAPLSQRVDPTQEEGSTLERALRHLNTELTGAVDAAREEYQRKMKPVGRETQPVTWDARRLEAEPLSKEPVDLDDESRSAVARRIKEVEARNRPRTDQDHKAFHDAIRKPAAQQAVELHGPSRADLRHAILWKEILGPPVGL